MMIYAHLAVTLMQLLKLTDLITVSRVVHFILQELVT